MASVYFCIYFISNKVDSSQIKYGKDTANLLMFLLIMALQASFFLYWAYQFIQEFKVTLILQYPRLYSYFNKNSISIEVEEYKARVMAPFIEQLKHTKDKIAQDINFYERGMVPLYDRDLRENMQKISQFHTKVEGLKKFHSQKALYPEVQDVIRKQAKADGPNRFKVMDSELSPRSAVADSEVMFGKDIITSNVMMSPSIVSTNKPRKSNPTASKPKFAFNLRTANSSSLKMNPLPMRNPSKHIQSNQSESNKDDDEVMILQSTRRQKNKKEKREAWGGGNLKTEESQSVTIKPRRIRQSMVREIAAGVDHEVISRLEQPISQIQSLVIHISDKTDDEIQQMRAEGSTSFPHFDN
ncbi:hypothetical protein FGO68_gene13860 [Halteria grandinella]|uniref:Uncharacterized protein n=1 Tax=Halteria grandinella TaxID=5974 RepID=A0A8J8SXK2_HALGN|nr:hypothetical protein FGO68_gene13860 [Halteria grandinella]